VPVLAPGMRGAEGEEQGTGGHREVGSGGSCRHTSDPRHTHRMRGSVGVRSPMAAGTLRCRCGGAGRQVTRLTLGALSTGLRRGWPRGFPTGGQPSAAGEKDRRRDPRPAQVTPARGHPLVSRRRRRYASGEAPTTRDGGGRQSPCARGRASHGTGGNGIHRTPDPAGDGAGAASRAPDDRLNTGSSPSGGAGHRRPDGRGPPGSPPEGLARESRAAPERHR